MLDGLLIASIALSVINFVAIASLWVFYLAKTLSTHSVRVVDIKGSVSQKRPVPSPPVEDDEERELTDFATSVSAKMFNRKERFNDPLL